MGVCSKKQTGAVNQLYKTMGGEVKKAQAVAQVQEWLAAYHITIDDKLIDQAIEAAVKNMNIEIKGE